MQDIFHTETTRFAHAILPGASFAEKDGTFTNGERRIQRVRKALEPLSGMAERQVICELSIRMGYPISYHHPLQIMDEIASLTPIYGGIQWFYPTKDHPETSTLYQELFSRPGGKARFVPSEFRGPGEVLLIQTKHLAHVE